MWFDGVDVYSAKHKFAESLRPISYTYSDNISNAQGLYYRLRHVKGYHQFGRTTKLLIKSSLHQVSNYTTSTILNEAKVVSRSGSDSTRTGDRLFNTRGDRSNWTPGDSAARARSTAAATKRTSIQSN